VGILIVIIILFAPISTYLRKGFEGLLFNLLQMRYIPFLFTMTYNERIDYTSWVKIKFKIN